MKIQLSDRFTYRRLIRFTLPSMGMMVFSSIYGVVDGLFVSNFAGKIPFAAINLIMPFLMVTGFLGFMVGAGGTAIVARTLGEGKPERANEIFSFLIYFLILSGLVITVVGLALMRPISIALGADEELLPYCVSYGRIAMISTVPFMLQNTFQSLLVTAERPTLGFAVTVAAGVTNIVGDLVLVGILKWGVVGAAIATTASEALAGVVPLIYFAMPNNSLLRLGRTRPDWKVLWETCVNGSSELMSSISMSVVSMVYNFQLMKFAGADGVAAYGVIMYIGFIFIAIFIGYSMGSAPIIAYNYGAENRAELRNLLNKSVKMIGILAVLMSALAIVAAEPLAKIFVGYDADLMAMTVRAFRIYAVSYLLSGFNIFGSSLFTALSNGLISAVISFFRSLVFQNAAVLLLPVFFGLDGIWYAIQVAELLAFFLTCALVWRYRERYGYL